MGLKQVGALGLISVGLGFLSFYALPLGAALLWPAASFAIVAAGYAGLGPRVFGKRVDGRFPLWAIVLLGPFLLLTLAVWHAVRLVSREPVCQEVAPGIWLGRRALPRELPEGVSLVVDLTAELPEAGAIARDKAYHCLPTLDALAPPLDELREQVRRVAVAGGGVYIHCASGHGRSALFAAALLVEKGLATTAAEAESMVLRARPAVRLSHLQRQRLAEFAT